MNERRTVASMPPLLVCVVCCVLCVLVRGRGSLLLARAVLGGKAIVVGAEVDGAVVVAVVFRDVLSTTTMLVVRWR